MKNNEDTDFKIKELTERESTSLKFHETLLEIFNTARGAKTSDYGETWKRLGLRGIYVKLFIKEGRLNNLVWHRKTPVLNNESVRDTLIDLAAYAVYGVMCLDVENMDGVDDRIDYERLMYEELRKKYEGEV